MKAGILHEYVDSYTHDKEPWLSFAAFEKVLQEGRKPRFEEKTNYLFISYDHYRLGFDLSKPLYDESGVTVSIARTICLDKIRQTRNYAKYHLIQSIDI